jgi:hypothetical protein
VSSTRTASATTTLTPTRTLTPTATLTPTVTLTPTATATRTLQAIVADIDGDGDFDPLTDAMLVMRWAFGFEGDTLIEGAVDVGCTYCTAAEIAAHIESLGTVLDIDGDGEVEALTDAVLLMRWGFGFRGEALIQGAIDTVSCTRCGLAEIEAYLDTLDGG